MKKARKGLIHINGKRIYLRKIRVSDINRTYCNWMNDSEINQFLESRFQKWTQKKLRDYVIKINKNPDNVFLAIILKKDNKHIGNIKVGPIDRIHKLADIGIIIGEKSLWGRGLAIEAIRLAVDYAFKRLKLHKLTAGTYANNIGSVRAFQRAGFKIEGIMRKHRMYKGRYVDEVILGIFQE